jgi:4-amino-4-deoxy-L-arabinose transferase-like glycosyltransferase
LIPASRLTTLSAAIEAAPCRALAIILALHALVWTALPTLLYPNLPLDLIEALTYGREWQLGYDKLPPLPWWLVEVAWRIAGHDFAYYLLAQIAVVVALAFVYAAARPIVGAAGALAAVLIVDGLHYLNYTAAKFNHDVIQLPFWAMAGYALHRALRRGRLTDWLLLGLAIGILVWAKYFVVVLVAPMVAFALIDKDARKALATPGPYVAAAVALIVAAPHLIWLVKNDFLPFAYAEHRAVLPRGWYDHLWNPLKFAVGQLGFMVPALIIALPLFWPRKAAGETPLAAPADDFDRRIVAWLAFGPFATVLLLGFISGRGAVAMWGYPLWMFFGLWLILHARRAVAGEWLARIVVTWSIVFAALAGAFVVNYEILPRFDHRYRAVFFPGEALAREITARTRAVTGQAPVYVIGSMWDGGNIGHYAKSRPRVLIDGKPERAPWIDIKDLHARGAVIVWTDADTTVVPPMYRTVAPDAAVQPSFTLPYRRGPGRVEIGWAILLPKPSFAMK